MFDPLLLLALLFGYLALMVVLARWAERRADQGRSLTDNPYVYAVSLATYGTSWTFYGSVGKAVDSGLLFLTASIGPTISIALWWIVVRRLVRIKSSYHVSSIADVLATRYGKSHSVGALAALMAFVGTLPYVALQIKSVTSTFTMMVDAGSAAFAYQTVGQVTAVLLVGYTIALGLRRMDPTDRHTGLVAAVTVKACVKLVALLAVGLFAVFAMNDGMGPLLASLPPERLERLLSLGGGKTPAYTTWASYLLLSMSAIYFLPHQFHLAVVENSDEKHLLSASWFLPLYLLLFNLFVLPIAAAGLKAGLPPSTADTFALGLPLLANNAPMVLLVFLGGVSAATSMVMVAATTNSIMLTNHVLLPLIERVPSLGFLKRRLLACRWAAVAVLILAAYWFGGLVGENAMLANIGIIAFGAVLQFAPAILGGLFWHGATKAGAITGLGLGFCAWLYTMLLPALARSLPQCAELVQAGPLGLAFLRPEGLFGISGLDPVTHSVFWSMLLNVGGFALVSNLTRHAPEELSVLPDFIGGVALRGGRQEPGDEAEDVDLREKCARMEATLNEYMSGQEARDLLASCLLAQGLAERERVTVTELAALYAEVEKAFSGLVGAAAAHRALGKAGVFSAEDTRLLGEAYGDMLAEMRITPDEMMRRVDYHMERERMLTRHAEELQETIRLRDQEILERRRIEEALRTAEENYRGIFLNAPEGIFQTSVAGAFTSANPAMAHILGYDSAEELMASVTDIAAQVYTEADGRARLLEGIAAKGVVEGLEAPLRRKDGSVIWGSIIARGVRDADGRLVGMEGMLADITERKRAVEELRESEARIRALFDATSDSVILMDLEGHILAINERGAARRNTPAEELKGKSVLFSLPEDVAASRIRHIREVAETRTPRTVEERRGESFYSVSIYPVLDPAGAPRQLASFSRDITDYRRSEETIRQLNEGLERRVQERTRQLEAANQELTRTLDQLTTASKQLVESEKMASLGGLVAGVAHEINTPVGIGVTAASHLEAKTRAVMDDYRAGALKRASLEEYLTVCDESTRMILSNLKRASDLIRSFKQVAVDRSTEEKRSFHLRGYLEEVLLSLRPHLKKTEHKVEFICDPELMMDSYPGALSQVLTNLVMNSLLHAFDPGEAGHLRIEASLDGGVVHFRYSDDGKGIAAEHLDKIFEPFYTTKRGRGGTGLGLHILYNLVTQKLKGAVRCESAPGRGTTFIITMPQGGQTL